MEGMKATIHIFEKNINYAKNRIYKRWKCRDKGRMKMTVT